MYKYWTFPYISNWADCRYGLHEGLHWLTLKLGWDLPDKTHCSMLRDNQMRLPSFNQGGKKGKETGFGQIAWRPITWETFPMHSAHTSSPCGNAHAYTHSALHSQCTDVWAIAFRSALCISNTHAYSNCVAYLSGNRSGQLGLNHYYAYDTSFPCIVRGKNAFKTMH